MSGSNGGSTRRRFLAGVGAAVSVGGLAVCSGTISSSASPSVFTLGTSAPFKGVNPLSTTSSYSWILLDLVYEGGTTIDPIDFSVQPNVFTDWTVENASGAGSSPDVYVAVRDGLTFTDGTALSVDDVIFTYDYLRKHHPPRYAGAVSAIESVERATGKWDVHLSLSSPDSTYDSDMLGVPILPKHVWSNVDSYRTYEPQKHDGPIGLGVGTLSKYDPTTSAEVTFRSPKEYVLGSLGWLENHPKLRSGGPFLDSVRVQIYGSQSALEQAFLGGDVDALFGSVDTSRVSDVRAASGKSLVDGYDTGFSYYGFNLRRAPLDDLTFRQALTFAFDDYHWVTELNDGYVYQGDFVAPPGYAAIRPETATGAPLLTDPATQAFDYRSTAKNSSTLDVEAVRSFLTDGDAITGEAGTFAGQHYPGSLTGVRASQTGGATHEYSLGPVRSKALSGADAELYVDGKPVTEHLKGPLEILVTPAKKSPKTVSMTNDWVSKLAAVGIPATVRQASVNTIADLAFSKEDFDVYALSWNSLPPFGVQWLYALFDGASADDHANGNSSTPAHDPMGYGLVADASANDLIERARVEMDPSKRNATVRKAVERIYLDCPVMVRSYAKVMWPVDSADWTGYVSDVPGPGNTELSLELKQLSPTG